jgi:hypothetical protein
MASAIVARIALIPVGAGNLTEGVPSRVKAAGQTSGKPNA